MTLSFWKMQNLQTSSFVMKWLPFLCLFMVLFSRGREHHSLWDAPMCVASNHELSPMIFLPSSSRECVRRVCSRICVLHLLNRFQYLSTSRADSTKPRQFITLRGVRVSSFSNISSCSRSFVLYTFMITLGPHVGFMCLVFDHVFDISKPCPKTGSL